MACGVIDIAESYLTFRTPVGTFITKTLQQLPTSSVPRDSVVVGCQIRFVPSGCNPFLHSKFRPVMCFPSTGYGCTLDGGGEVSFTGSEDEFYLYMSGWDYVACNTSTIEGSFIVDGYLIVAGWEDVAQQPFTIKTIAGVPYFSFTFQTTPPIGSTIALGDDVSCRLAVTNNGSVTGVTTGTITKNGTSVESESLTVAPGETKYIYHTDTPASGGTVIYCGASTGLTAKCSEITVQDPGDCISITNVQIGSMPGESPPYHVGDMVLIVVEGNNACQINQTVSLSITKDGNEIITDSFIVDPGGWYVNEPYIIVSADDGKTLQICADAEGTGKCAPLTVEPAACDPGTFAPHCDDYGNWLTCVDGNVVMTYDPEKCPINGGGECAAPGDVSWIVEGESYCKMFTRYECVDGKWKTAGFCFPKKPKVEDYMIIGGIALIGIAIFSRGE